MNASRIGFQITFVAFVILLGSANVVHAQNWGNRRENFDRMRQSQNDNMSSQQRQEESQRLYEQENARAGIMSNPNQVRRPVSMSGDVDPMIEIRRQRNMQTMSQISPPTPLPAAIARRTSAAQEINMFTLPGLESKAMGPLQLERFK